MTYLLNVRKEVASFALLMEAKLRKNDAKYAGNSWKTNKESTPDNLSRWMDIERSELRAAIMDWENIPEANLNRRNVAEEAADVANYAMMIADVSGGLTQEAGQISPYKHTERAEEELIKFFNADEIGKIYGENGDVNNWIPVECAIETIKLLHAKQNTILVTEAEADRIVLRAVAVLARLYPEVDLEMLEVIAGNVFLIMFPGYDE